MEKTQGQVMKASRVIFWWVLVMILGWVAEELVSQVLQEVDRTVSLALALSIVATGQSYVLRRWMPGGGVWVFATTIGGVAGFLMGFQIAASDAFRTNEYLSTILWWGSIGAGVGIAQALSMGKLKLARWVWILANVVGFAFGGGLMQFSRTFLPAGYLQPLILGLASGVVVGLMLTCLLSRAGYEV